MSNLKALDHELQRVEAMTTSTGYTGNLQAYNDLLIESRLPADRPSIFQLDMAVHELLAKVRTHGKFAMSFASYGKHDEAAKHREYARQYQLDANEAKRVFEAVTQGRWDDLSDERFGYSLRDRVWVYYRDNSPLWLRKMDRSQYRRWIDCQMPSLEALSADVLEMASGEAG